MKTEGDLTVYLCAECLKANKQQTTHPGRMHKAGICDCACRGERWGKLREKR